MRGIFDVDRPGREVWDVALEYDLAHELMEERGHFEAVELAEQRRVMETDPPESALLHRLLEGGLGNGRPAIRWVIDLNEQIVGSEMGLVYWIGRPDVVDFEAFLDRRLPQPAKRCV